LRTRKSGAKRHHLERCSQAPCSDFKDKRALEDSGTSVTWNGVFSDTPISAKEVNVPLPLAVCHVSGVLAVFIVPHRRCRVVTRSCWGQLSMIWEKILEKGSGVRGVTLGTRTVQVNQLRSLSLSESR
jgi:hypothetical protein